MPLQAGAHLGPYEILASIGAGGMGEVYRARDIRLNRTVAIKILPDEGADEAARRRFQREAEAASALNHPHILAIHDTGNTAGRQFIVMELADGGTLREWLAAGRRWRQVLEMLIGVADALGAAHAAGIVHRDIKPENILITQSGYAKLSDFGVAMLTAPVAEAMSTRTQATKPGALIGTFGYMAPEQLRGDPADGRTDIFSFGVLMYESLAGRRPFEAHTEPALAAAILTDAPPPLERIVPDVPPELSRIVAKTLEKDPARRYQSAVELAIDLRRLQQTSQPSAEPHQIVRTRRRPAATVIAGLLVVAAAAAGAYYWVGGRPAAIQSVAVLPIANATGDPAVEYLSDGMTDSIIARLSEIPALKVMSHSAVFHYKGRDVDARTLGQELGVEALLIGRLLKRGDSFGFRLELVSARDASFIWGDQYDRPLAELPALQREMPLDIATKLRPRLGSAPLARLEKTHTENAEASQLYLKGRYSWEKWTSDGARQAVDFFERAIAVDPSYALAYAGLSDAYLVGPGVPGLTEQEARRRAREAATKALSLDPQLAEPHLALAGVLLFDAWDLAGAEREYLRALELNSSCAECHHLYSHLLLMLGRYPESLRESQKLLELDPVSETPTGHLANHYLIARQFDAAIAQYKEDRRRFPDAARNEEFGDALYFGGRVAEAIDEYFGALSAGKTPDVIPALRAAYANGGPSAFFRQRLAQFSAVAPAEQNRMAIAAYHARLGESDPALKTLEEGYAAHASWMVLLHNDPSFDALRRDPRYSDLLRRVGLPQL